MWLWYLQHLWTSTPSLYKYVRVHVQYRVEITYFIVVMLQLRIAESAHAHGLTLVRATYVYTRPPPLRLLENISLLPRLMPPPTDVADPSAIKVQLVVASSCGRQVDWAVQLAT